MADSFVRHSGWRATLLLAVVVALTQAPAFAQDAAACSQALQQCMAKCAADHPPRSADARPALQACRSSCTEQRQQCMAKVQAAQREQAEGRRAEQQAENERRRAEQRQAMENQPVITRMPDGSTRTFPNQQAYREYVQSRDREREARRQGQAQWCERLSEWLRKHDGMPPEVLRRRFEAGAVSMETEVAAIPYEAWVMQDVRLQALLGKTFDALAPAELEGHARDSQSCPQAVATAGAARHLAPPGVFYTAAHASQYGRVVEGVRRIREGRQQALAARDELPSLAATDAGLARLLALQATLRKSGAYFAAEERAGLDAALADARTRVASPVAAARVSRALAQARGFEGLQALVQLERELQQGSLGARPGEAAPAWFGELKAGQSRIVGELTAAERARVDALGDGLDGLERGVAWYREFESRLRIYVREMPEVFSLAEHFSARRTALFDRVRPELTARIAAAASEAELEQLRARYWPLAFDSTSGARMLAGAADRRRAELAAAAAPAAAPGRFDPGLSAGSIPETTPGRPPGSQGTAPAADERVQTHPTFGEVAPAPRLDPTRPLTFGRLMGHQANSILYNMQGAEYSRLAASDELRQAREIYWRCYPNCSEQVGAEFARRLVAKDLYYLVALSIGGGPGAAAGLRPGVIDGGIVAECLSQYQVWRGAVEDGAGRMPGTAMINTLRLRQGIEHAKELYGPYSDCRNEAEFKRSPHGLAAVAPERAAPTSLDPSRRGKTTGHVLVCSPDYMWRADGVKPPPPVQVEFENAQKRELARILGDAASPLRQAMARGALPVATIGWHDDRKAAPLALTYAENERRWACSHLGSFKRELMQVSTGALLAPEKRVLTCWPRHIPERGAPEPVRLPDELTRHYDAMIAKVVQSIADPTGEVRKLATAGRSAVVVVGQVGTHAPELKVNEARSEYELHRCLGGDFRPVLLPL
jgi:hypothetical protein